MPQKIQVKRGVKANLPTLSVGEPAFTTDTKQVFVGDGTTNVELAKQTDLNTTNVNVTNLTTMIDASAEMIRDSIPSGFTQLSDIDYTYMSTNPNTIKLSSDSVAYVNGYKTKIPSGTIITLNAPPTTGTRDDLVFLECWKQTDVNGIITWNNRIRVIDGVDFNTYPIDGISVLTNPNGYINVPQYINPTIVAQGGSVSPTSKVFQYYNQRSQTWGVGIAPTDTGLYISGTGSLSDKTTLNTTDGYVYAIPMFRVKRRNSSGYSENNGNGSINYALPLATTNAYTGTTPLPQILTLTFTTDVSSILKVGSTLIRVGGTRIGKIIAVNGTAITVDTTAYTIGNNFNISNFRFYPSDLVRSDLLYSDIVDTRDILDLRHQVSLTGFNFQQLLEENFDKLLCGELQTSTKTQMLKTYHGIPKTTTDSNTIFYASLDGTTTAEIGGNLNTSVGFFKPMPTGLGYKFPNIAPTPISITGLNSNYGTIDFFINTEDLKYDNAWSTPISIYDNSNNPFISIVFNKALSNLYCEEKYTDNSSRNTGATSCYIIDYSIKYTHIRASWDINNLYFRANGILLNTTSRNPSSKWRTPSKILLGGTTGTNICLSTLADVSVSNIDRGATFTNIPQDFIDGYARISLAFNEQRNVYSDALTSETDFVQVKASGTNPRAVSTTQATGGAWVSGDAIKVKGLSNEIISGVIDADTAIARIISGNLQTLIVDDISKLSIGDTFFIGGNQNDFVNVRTITAVDITTNTITFTGSGVGTLIPSLYPYLFENTPSTSSPIVQYYNGSTLTSVTGTWSGLGTNQATFTLGTNSGLTNQDLYINYSLNEVSGQGGISEVLTTTLGGESNGKRLAINSNIHIKDDFAGKISGSVSECPNVYKALNSSSLGDPSSFINEWTTSQYQNIKTLDNLSQSLTSSSNGLIPQHLFSFNLIRILEDKFGTLPCASDIASKVAWLKVNIKSITFNWWGYGSCSSGNKAYVALFLGTWSTHNSQILTNTPSQFIGSISEVNSTWKISNAIQPNGMIHMLVYTGASDGTTSSVINTDYVNIEMILNTPNGYDVLTPENPRRDDGKGNVLLVRKETKEIQTMFPRTNADGIVTYGDYIPYQFSSDSISRELLCYMEKLWIISNGTGSPNIDFAPTKISARLPKYNGLLKVWDDYMLVNTDLVALNGINISDTGNLSSYFLPPKTAIFGKLVGDSNSIPKYRTGEYVNTLPAIYAENLKSPCPHLLVSCGLAKDNDGSLLMLIRTTFTRGNDCCSAGNGTTSVVGVIRLANRPLIK
jgi:hypothetical protein